MEKQLSRFARKLLLAPVEKNVPPAPILEPIRDTFWSQEKNFLITASWDKTIKYWDGKSATPGATLQLPERVYSVDVQGQLLVAATADRKIVVVNLNNPGQIFSTIISPLKFQSRSVACFPDQRGFCLGSIEGRVAVHHVNKADEGKNFAFKCHRENSDIYAVNSIAFHPTFGTFATTGADGTFNFWDKVPFLLTHNHSSHMSHRILPIYQRIYFSRCLSSHSQPLFPICHTAFFLHITGYDDDHDDVTGCIQDSRQRLKAFKKGGLPIPVGTFNKDGTIFAYAASYDWSKGSEHYNPKTNHLLLHSVPEDEIKSRSQKNKGFGGR